MAEAPSTEVSLVDHPQLVGTAVLNHARPR
jgi:hypothetical protein